VLRAEVKSAQTLVLRDEPAPCAAPPGLPHPRRPGHAQGWVGACAAADVDAALYSWRCAGVGLHCDHLAPLCDGLGLMQVHGLRAMLGVSRRRYRRW
jgi:hypothetical protein